MKPGGPTRASAFSVTPDFEGRSFAVPLMHELLPARTLASGVPMATVLFTGPQLGLIVLPLILFHQIQLIVCAILARHYARRQTPVVNQEAG